MKEQMSTPGTAAATSVQQVSQFTPGAARTAALPQPHLPIGQKGLLGERGAPPTAHDRYGGLERQLHGANYQFIEEQQVQQQVSGSLGVGLDLHSLPFEPNLNGLLSVCSCPLLMLS